MVGVGDGVNVTVGTGEGVAVSRITSVARGAGEDNVVEKAGTLQ